MQNQFPSIAVLGAGISGLAVAFTLQQKGYDVTVFEKSDHAGGVIQTVDDESWKLELGPNTLLINSDPISQFFKDADLKNHIIEANAKTKKRYIVKNEALVPVPLSVWSFLNSDLLSFAAKMRLLKEPFAGTLHSGEESIAEFIERRLGTEPLAYGINPFVSGVYAGDPKKLSIKHTFSSLYKMEQQHGSLFKGMMAKKKRNNTPRSLVSFKEGMQALPKKIALKLKEKIQFNTKITKIRETGTAWEVMTRKHTANYDAIISTIPSHSINSIFDTPETKNITKISYAPMSILHLGFRKEQIKHPLDGFGMLIPEAEGKNLLGCLFSSTLFPARAPKDHVLLTCFMGGARQPELTHRPKKEQYNIALGELADLLHLTGDPVFRNHTCWKQAIPQYNVGYDCFLESIEKTEQQHPGLFIGGNFRGGVSVPDCIENGIALSEKVVTHLET